MMAHKAKIVTQPVFTTVLKRNQMRNNLTA